MNGTDISVEARTLISLFVGSSEKLGRLSLPRLEYSEMLSADGRVASILVDMAMVASAEWHGKEVRSDDAVEQKATF